MILHLGVSTDNLDIAESCAVNMHWSKAVGYLQTYTRLSHYTCLIWATNLSERQPMSILAMTKPREDVFNTCSTPV